MTLDPEMAEIAKVFFQESREGLDIMESGLLSLGATADSENINTIFRAAHSIKGGSATFGFAAVADLRTGWRRCSTRCATACGPSRPKRSDLHCKPAIAARK